MTTTTTTSSTKLIARADTRRDLGLDTTQLAMGRMSTDEATMRTGAELCVDSNEYTAIADGLARYAAKICSWQVATELNGLRVTCRITVLENRARHHEATTGADERAARNRMFKLILRLPSCRDTEMEVTLRIDRNGNRWLNLRANATSMVNGYNAHAVALEGVSADREMLTLLKLPFCVLHALLRRAGSTFAWSDMTQTRIDNGLFRICPVQIFTYLPSPSGDPQRLLGLLRAVLSTPFEAAEGEKGSRHRLVADVLGVELASRTRASKAAYADVETLLLVLRKGGRRLMSINLYDKLAKAEVDAEVVKRDVGDSKTQRFLARSIRLDVTLSEGALVDLLREARLANNKQAAPTAAQFVEAMRVLDTGKGRSKRSCLAWLLKYIFDERLPLLKLLAFRPSMIDDVRTKLAAVPKALAAFNEWRHRGFEFQQGKSGRAVSFVQFATKHAKRPLSRQQARSVRSVCLNCGLDPDLPMVAHQVLFAQSHVWSMTAEERRRFCRALEQGNARVAFERMQASHARSQQTVSEIDDELRAMIKEAHAPANMIELKPASMLAPPRTMKPKLAKRPRSARAGRHGDLAALS